MALVGVRMGVIKARVSLNVVYLVLAWLVGAVSRVHVTLNESDASGSIT